MKSQEAPLPVIPRRGPLRPGGVGGLIVSFPPHRRDRDFLYSPALRLHWVLIRSPGRPILSSRHSISLLGLCLGKGSGTEGARHRTRDSNQSALPDSRRKFLFKKVGGRCQNNPESRSKHHLKPERLGVWSGKHIDRHTDKERQQKGRNHKRPRPKYKSLYIIYPHSSHINQRMWDFKPKLSRWNDW